MAALDPNAVLSVPGRFCKAPTDLTTDFPHGGTSFGYVSEVVFRPVITYAPIVYEDRGERMADLIEVQGTGTLAFVARQWDEDILSSVWPTTTSQDDGSEMLKLPGGLNNRLVGSRGFVLVFSPLDPRSPGLLCYRAVPVIAQEVNLRFNRSDELGLLCSFFLLDNGSGNAIAVEKLSNLDGVLP